MRRVFPGKSDGYFNLLWLVMDSQDVGHIELDAFVDIYELTHLSVKDLDDDQTLAGKCCPKFYDLSYSRFFIACVKSAYFRYVFDAAILANAVFIALDLDGGESFFVTFFSVEIVAKVYAFGGFEFLKKLWNVFDLLVVGSAVLVSIIGLFPRQDCFIRE